MVDANNQPRHVWPEDSSTVAVKLDAIDIIAQYPAFNFLPKIFDIRTPPTPDDLSSSKCIAMVLSVVEGHYIVYTLDKST
mmetsp:Transcript_2850/g.4089  ORF Transcript_2850/g.4089 Transcript_2850/m.4089 type:complete len:80 (+) Transcript_2850:96-335(+)